MSKLRLCLGFVLCFSPIFADRWLVLPPRIEAGPEVKNLPQSGDLARSMALYLRISRVGEIVQVAEAEGCLRQAGISMAQKIPPEALRAVAKQCMAERMLLMRVRAKSQEFEITSKVYFRDSDQLTDTLVTTGGDLNTAIGQNLAERFGKTPATPKESSADLIVAGDTYGGSYFDWPHLKSLFLSIDSVKSAYCLADAQGTVQTMKPQADKGLQKEFLDKLRFAGAGSYSDASAVFACANNAAAVARQEGRTFYTVIIPSDFPRESGTQIKARAEVRRLARSGKVMIAPAASATADTQLFWQRLAREMGENCQYLPSAQRVKLGLTNGQEWYIFRRGGRLYESRTAEPAHFEGGVVIPEKYANETAPADLPKLYETLSKNRIASPGTAEHYGVPLHNALAKAFKTAASGTAAWRILLDQNGQTYYISLTARDAQKLKTDSFARVYVELKSPTQTELLRNRPSPALVLENAADSAPPLELNVTQYMRSPEAFLRKGIGGRSFYILTGKVVRIIPPEGDALESDF